MSIIDLTLEPSQIVELNLIPSQTIDLTIKTDDVIDLVLGSFQTISLLLESPQIINLESAISIGDRGPVGPQGPPGLPGNTIVKTAAMTLSGHRLVVPIGVNEVVYADPTNPAHAHLPIWLTLNAALIGEDVTVRTFGEEQESSWVWNFGELLYLGELGVLTQITPSSPSFLLEVGRVVSSDTIFFEPKMPIVLV